MARLSRIIASDVVIHDVEPRTKRKCSECDKIRLTTRITNFEVDDPQRIWEEYLCDDCLTRTPNWS